jgi:hypothetical protein
MFVILYFFLLAISLLVLTASDYPFGIFRHFLVLSFFIWPLCCLSFDLRIMIARLVSSSFPDHRWFNLAWDPKSFVFLKYYSKKIGQMKPNCVWIIIGTYYAKPVHFYDNQEMSEDTKGIIGSCKILKSKDRQHNGQMKKDKRTNNYLQKHYREN